MASKKKQRKWMRHALYDAYQMAGALGAGGKALDNFYAAASGRKPPHDDVLPIYLPLWETELQARVVHLQEKLLETDAELLYMIEEVAGERQAWSKVKGATNRSRACARAIGCERRFPS